MLQCKLPHRRPEAFVAQDDGPIIAAVPNDAPHRLQGFQLQTAPSGKQMRRTVTSAHRCKQARSNKGSSGATA